MKENLKTTEPGGFPALTLKKMTMENQTIWCERCGEKLNPKKAKWLELSNTDGNYYVEIPKSHISQGAFSFGTACATAQLNETRNILLTLNQTKS